MRIYLLIFTLLFSNSSLLSLSKLQLPDGNLRYDQTCFLASHNAYANRDEGWRISPYQSWSLEKQLDNGVRALLLDVFPHKKGALLCHMSCGKEHLLVQKGPTTKKVAGIPVPNLPSAKTFKSALRTVGKWLKENPKEVATVFIENYVDNDDLKKEILSIKGLSKYILTKKDWDPDTHDGYWPTLQWMRNNNKRLIIFLEDKSKSKKIKDNAPFFYIYNYIEESRWGIFDMEKICSERKESKESSAKNRRLYFLNYFRKRKSTSDTNSYETLNKLINLCKKEGIFKNRTPNFINLDFVDKSKKDKKDVIDLINELNRKQL